MLHSACFWRSLATLVVKWWVAAGHSDIGGHMAKGPTYQERPETPFYLAFGKFEISAVRVLYWDNGRAGWLQNKSGPLHKSCPNRNMYLNSVYNTSEIDTERNVILEEINMYEDTPDEMIHDLSTQNIWDGHMLGTPIIGDRDSVSKIDQKKILDYFKTHYTPDNTIIAVAGDIDNAKVVEQIKDKFGSIKGQKSELTEEVPHIVSGIKIILKMCNTICGLNLNNFANTPTNSQKILNVPIFAEEYSGVK